MYRKKSVGWLKHIDFIALDQICLQVAFVLAYMIRHGGGNPYGIELYRGMAFFLFLIDFVVLFFMQTLSGVMKRRYYQEFVITFKHALMVELLAVLYLFVMRVGGEYSRTILLVTGAIYFVITYVIRIVMKKALKREMNKGSKRSLLIVTTRSTAADIVENIRENNFESYNISGLVILDEDMTGQEINGVTVVANVENVPEYICSEWVDEVFLNPTLDMVLPQKMISDFVVAGITVHINLLTDVEWAGKRQLVESVANYKVLTTSINYATEKQVFFKRTMDIVGGLVGCVLTAIIFVFVAPAIYIQSPGPIFFSQERVGKNGKKFRIYKFRSMYLDAEERKKELMEQNRVKDGMMFKLDFDTRVIGNKILPDGTHKTGIGNFLRVTSLDEFPQFYNVLKGDMSLVGTRPPTLDEWVKYELHHRTRMAIKPGITGMWQVSGRSKITDFEEIVKLDTQYITEWSIGLDIKILLKTVLAVVKRDGSM